MTPKEKAIELVSKFSIVGLQQRNEGIACALICVDEIFTAIPLQSFYYWQEVKTEIEKL